MILQNKYTYCTNMHIMNKKYEYQTEKDLKNVGILVLFTFLWFPTNCKLFHHCLENKIK